MMPVSRSTKMLLYAYAKFTRQIAFKLDLDINSWLIVNICPKVATFCICIIAI